MSTPPRIPPAAPGLLAGKVAFITGAGRGIGAASARLFAREGARVVLAARTEAQLREVCEAIRAEGGSADYVVADLAQADSVRNAVQTVVRLHGRLDVAFNNAGVATSPGPMLDMSEAEFDQLTTVNYKSLWLLLREEIQAIRATAGKGAIVNNSSVSSLRSSPTLGPYGATKRAINSLTETAAVEYGPEGIRVNAIAPGTTLTEKMQQWADAEPHLIDTLNARTPLRRPASPQEVAEAAAWLLSDRASYVTGVVLAVDGGFGT